ncbi:uncharacterized protein LOC135940133 [Cloeon dipterum]|uniref:uncharacterized protein LOC135940133 n=1 Tax=Cloeon dipterum TaxID=197152 RepID=UPI00321FFE08
MSYKDDILQPLKSADIPKLMNVLMKDLPNSSWIYDWIKTQLDWLKELKRVRVLVLCPRGDWTTGTVIALNVGLANNGKVFGAIYSIETDGVLLKKCLIESEMIPWRAMSDYVTVSEGHANIYLDALKVKGLQVIHHATCAIAYMPPDDAKIVVVPVLPAGARIAPLDVDRDLDTVWDNWPHFPPDFKPVLQMMIRFNPSFGIFVTCEDGREELASMIVQASTVGLGILQTLSKHRRKGFAHILLAHVTKNMGQAGIGSMAHIIATQNTSIVKFKKVGYKFIGQSKWVKINN